MRSSRVSVSMPAELKQMLRRCAAREGRSEANFAAELLRSGLAIRVSWPLHGAEEARFRELMVPEARASEDP